MNDDGHNDVSPRCIIGYVMLGLEMCPVIILPCIALCIGLVVLVMRLLITGVVWFAVHVLPYVLMSVAIMTIVSGPVAAITWALRRI